MTPALSQTLAVLIYASYVIAFPLYALLLTMLMLYGFFSAPAWRLEPVTRYRNLNEVME